MTATSKIQPFNSPHDCTGGWWYEDENGINVYGEVRDEKGNYITTVSWRLLWHALIPAAKRCGKIK